MKKLSDYTDEKAIEIWGDLLPVIAKIIKDGNIKESFKNADGTMADKLTIATNILKTNKTEICELLKIIDDTPINAMNVLIRTISFLDELLENEEVLDFLGLSELTHKSTQPTYGGSVTENTMDDLK